jgi:glycosyltransferase involved in cell wall biosynthesis
MRVGIDARELAGRVTGVGRYLGSLLAEWGRDGSARRHEFVLYSPADLPGPLDTRRFATRIISGSGGTYWEQLTLPAAVARDHIDLFFAPAYSAPLRLTMPTVLAIHDVSFAAHPEWFGIREGARRRFLTAKAASRAQAIVTISEFSRREIVERLGVPPAKVRVIIPGIPTPSALGPQPSPQPSALSSQLSVLYVGSIFNRRHVPDLIRAFAPIARAHADASLDIVGDDRSYPRQNLATLIDAEGLRQQVRWHEYVSDDRLNAMYARARAFAFLSEYEGLGFTPLEALARGVPPVVLDTAVARESCGDAAIYVRCNDRAGTTRALETLLFDEEARRRVLESAPGVLARYDWSRAARETLALLADVAG